MIASVRRPLLANLRKSETFGSSASAATKMMVDINIHQTKNQTLTAASALGFYM
jgi:hypothetical protein